MLRRILVCTAYLVMCAAPGSPEPLPAFVGPYGDIRTIAFTGNHTFSGEEIIRALRFTPALLLASHPRTPMGEYIDYLKRHIERGYLNAGFPETTVAAQPDGARGLMQVTIEEGRRLTAGPVLVEGNRAIATAEIVKALTEPRIKPATEDEKEETLDPLWTPGGSARLGQSVLRKLARHVRQVYFREGYLEADLKTEFRYPGKDRVSPVVVVAREGKQCSLGAVTFEGDFKDDPEEVKRVVGIRPGMALSQDVREELIARLDRLGRYLKTEVRFKPAGQSGVMDMTVRLFQADFAPPLASPTSEVLGVLRKARRWLCNVDGWGGGLVIRVEGAAQAGATHEKLPGFFQFILDPDGICLEVKIKESGEGYTEHLLLLVSRYQGLLKSSAARLISRFDVRTETSWIFNVDISANDPEADTSSQSSMAIRLGLGFTGATEATLPFRLQISVSQIAATKLTFETDARYSFDDQYLYVDGLAEDSSPFRIAAIDRRTGQIIMDFKRERGLIRVSARMEKDPIARRLREAQAEAAGLDFQEVSPILFLLRVARTYVEQLLDSGVVDTHVDTRLVRLLLDWHRREEPRIERALAWFFSKKKEPSEEKETFQIPHDQVDPASIGNPMTFVVNMVAPALVHAFPHDSWPQVLTREVACMLTGQARYTREEVMRLFRSSRVGPVGYWAFAETFALLGQGPLSREFARRGLAECNTVHGFRKEMALVNQEGSVSAAVVRFLGEAVQTLDQAVAAEIGRRIRDHGSAGLKTYLPFFEKARGSAEPLESGTATLRGIWEVWILPALRLRLQLLLRPPAPTRDIPL